MEEPETRNTGKRILQLEIEFIDDVRGVQDGQVLNNEELVDYFLSVIDSIRKTKVRIMTRKQEEERCKDNSLENWSQHFEWTEEVRRLNSSVFNNDSFRSQQEEVINAILYGKDVFACMPTGSGKSLLFQLPSLCFEWSKGVSLVVVPLIALVSDQIRQLEIYDIRSYVLTSKEARLKKIATEIKQLRDQCKPVLFASPEVVDSAPVFSFLTDLHNNGLLDRVFFDEAHCVIEWGSTFRQSYLNLRKLRSNSFNIRQIVMLTGSAPPVLRKTLISSMRMRDPAVFVRSHNRENLFLQVVPSISTEKDIRTILRVMDELYPNKSGIIYCRTKSNCNDLHSKLEKLGKTSIAVFTGDLTVKQKNQVLEDWLSDEVQVVIATVAFGMGINKPDVRFVIHYDIAGSMENYYQGIGRAGRDGLESLCLTFFSPNDIRSQESLLRENSKGVSRFMYIYTYCMESYKCRRHVLLNYFEKYDDEECEMCDNCMYRKYDGYARTGNGLQEKGNKKNKKTGGGENGQQNLGFSSVENTSAVGNVTNYNLEERIGDLRDQLDMSGFSNEAMEEEGRGGRFRKKKKGQNKEKPLTVTRLVESLLGKKDCLVKGLTELLPVNLPAIHREIIAYSMVGLMLRDGMLMCRWVNSKKSFGYMTCYCVRDGDLGQNEMRVSSAENSYIVQIGVNLKERGLERMVEIMKRKPVDANNQLLTDLLLVRSKLFRKYKTEINKGSVAKFQASSSTIFNSDTLGAASIHKSVEEFMPTKVFSL